jgi:hypothetical protein
MPAHRMRRAPRVAAGLAAAALGWGAASSANEPPAIVFKTRPPAVNGTISGRGPLDVTFNMCPTSDPDPGDLLKFTYDFDNDGIIDYYGHCRQTHRYPASDRCPEATVCASDRQPGHRVCRTYTVCALGGNGEPGPSPSPRPSPSPFPSPSPSPSPDILPFTYDLYAFTGTAGTNVDVSVDTVSAATAFDPWACVSTTPEGCVLFDENVVEWGDDDQACTFPPPTYECPAFRATLPVDGVYYLLVSDAAEDDFAGDVGLYALTVGSDGAIGRLELLADNAPDSKLPPKKSQPPATLPAAPAEKGGAPAVRPRPVRPAPVKPAEPPSPVKPAEPSSEEAGQAPASQGAAAKPAPPGAAKRTDSGTAPEIVLGPDTRDAGDARPEAVFRTLPRASAKGRITGGGLFDVTFDLCASAGRDPEKELTFSYDFDGDGARDDSGRCRQTHRYRFDGSGPRCVASVACVGDGKQSHETCRTYTICGAPPRP